MVEDLEDLREVTHHNSDLHRRHEDGVAHQRCIEEQRVLSAENRRAPRHQRIAHSSGHAVALEA
jgi:hypothetical protein